MVSALGFSFCRAARARSSGVTAAMRPDDLLAEAGLRGDAKALRFVSDEVPYDDTLSLRQAFALEPELVYLLAGGPFPDPGDGVDPVTGPDERGGDHLSVSVDA